MHKILIRPHARTDLKKIWRYTYENWGEKQADNYTGSLGSRINSLVGNPLIGGAINHVRKGYRLYHHQHHFIIYRVSNELIEVVRVLGERMNVQGHL